MRRVKHRQSKKSRQYADHAQRKLDRYYGPSNVLLGFPCGGSTCELAITTAQWNAWFDRTWREMGGPA